MTPPTEPEGWVTLPREPSREMWAAMGNALVGYRQRHHDVVAAALWKAVIEASPPAPVEPMRKALSDEDVERAVAAFRKSLRDGGLIRWSVDADGNVITAMRAALSVLPPVAGGGEVAGLIEEGDGWSSGSIVEQLCDAVEPFLKHYPPSTRLMRVQQLVEVILEVHPLEGRL